MTPILLPVGPPLVGTPEPLTSWERVWLPYFERAHGLRASGIECRYCRYLEETESSKRMTQQMLDAGGKIAEKGTCAR